MSVAIDSFPVRERGRGDPESADGFGGEAQIPSLHVFLPRGTGWNRVEKLRKVDAAHCVDGWCPEPN